MRRNFIFGIVTLVIVLAALELQAWGLGVLSVRFHVFRNVLYFYRADIFSHLSDARLAQLGNTSPLGWPDNDNPRPAPRVAHRDDYRLLSDNFWDAAHPSGSGVLARRLIDRLAQASRKRNARLVVVMLPHVDRVLVKTPAYDRFADDLRRRGDVCVIDPRPLLYEQERQLGADTLAAPNRHYNALGNRLIADAARDGLERCGLVPR